MTMPEPAEIAGVMARRGWLAGQPESFAADLLARSRPRHFRRGDLVYRDGEVPGGVFGIVSGGIGIVTARAGRAPVLTHIQRAGAWFGEAPYAIGNARTVSFRATEASSLLFVPASALEEIARSEPQARLRFAGFSRWAIEEIGAMVGDLLIPNAERRIAATLLRITAAAEGVPPDDPQGFVVTQTELGEMANVSRHHVNRTLTRFRKQGWVDSRYNRLRLLDLGALEAMAAG
jgi:CRP/FNR family transcriptional regulator, cyclic AMP receptor protein